MAGFDLKQKQGLDCLGLGVDEPDGRVLPLGWPWWVARGSLVQYSQPFDLYGCLGAIFDPLRDFALAVIAALSLTRLDKLKKRINCLLSRGFWRDILH